MRTLNLFILLICTTYSFGQLFVNPRPVTGFQVLSDDVLTFDIINTPRGDKAQETVKVRFLITIHSAEGPVVEMFSGSHVLRPGLNSFLSSNCNIVRKNYLQRAYSTFEAKTQSLPIGNYQYCIRLLEL